MSMTINAVSWTQDTFESPNKVRYTSPAHTFSVKDLITLARTAPKPTADFAGVARAEMKRTKTVTLADGSKADAIITISCSLPVGISATDADALRDDVGDWALEGSYSGALFKNHDLTF